LRELLNFETNEHKLLQIVIFAQDEISQVLEDHPNFSDRISLYYQLKPLDHRDTARLIAHRLIFANGGKKLPPAPVFTTRTVKKIYKLSRGYPRRIIYLSYQAMLLLLIKGGSKITPDIIIQASKNLPSMDGHSSAGKKSPWAYAAATAMVGLTIGAIGTAAYKSQPYFKDTNRTPEVVAQRSAPEKIPEQNKSFLKTIQPAPAALQEQKPAVAKRPARQQDLPAYLGHIRIQAGQRLWDAAGKVYGRVTPAILKKIQIANPDLTDPDKIRVGQKIRLPVTDPKTPDQDQLWWIALEISSELEPVFRIITHDDNGDLGLLSFWSPDRGMFHAAVVKQQFSGPEAVKAAMAELEQTAFTRAKIIDLSKDGICLLTSPSFSDTKPVEVNN
jgi:general secretion pathway protein A